MSMFEGKLQELASSTEEGAEAQLYTLIASLDIIPQQHTKAKTSKDEYDSEKEYIAKNGKKDKLLIEPDKLTINESIRLLEKFRLESSDAI